MGNENTEFYTHTRELSIETHEVDFQDKIKLSALMRIFENVACSSADECGFGYDVLKKDNRTFMLVKLHVEFLSEIRLHDRVKVKTWPTQPGYAIFKREYQVEAGEKSVVNATSDWCLIDRTENRILPSKVLTDINYPVNPTRAFLYDGKLKGFDAREDDFSYKRTVYESDLDHNDHVNNTRYADYIVDCFSSKFLSKKSLKRFSIDFMKQSFEGDELSFYKRENAGVFLINGYNQKGEAVVRAELEFKE